MYMVLIIGAQMFIPVHVNFCLLSDEIQRKKVPDQFSYKDYTRKFQISSAIRTTQYSEQAISYQDHQLSVQSN